ncbi:MAG: hypothetical protein RIR77_2299 [Planctomycetota bacterium]
MTRAFHRASPANSSAEPVALVQDSVVFGVNRARSAGWGVPNTSGSSFGAAPVRIASNFSNCVRGALSGNSGLVQPAAINNAPTAPTAPTAINANFTGCVCRRSRMSRLLAELIGNIVPITPAAPPPRRMFGRSAESNHRCRKPPRSKPPWAAPRQEPVPESPMNSASP